MKTIDKILALHNTNLLELGNLELNGYINGCGGKGGFQFDKYLKDIIEDCNEFLLEKQPELYKDLRIICLCHDRGYHYKKGFYLSNYWMARDIFLLTHWLGFFKRLSLSLGLFILLCKFGKTYYK